MYTEYKEGSKWIKCDFHIHTPCSVLNNQFGDNFEEYVKKMLRKALENDIQVIAITDYYTIDGYKKLKEEYLENEVKLKEIGFLDEEILKIKQILFLANIEFRLNVLIDNSKVNFHVILSNEIKIRDIENNFLSRIEFSYNGKEVRSLRKEEVENLGKRLKEEQPELKGSDYKIGIEQIAVDSHKIIELLENSSIFRNKYLIVVPPDEDLSNLNWRGQSHHIRKILIQQAHCLFSSNKSTISWGLGEKSENKEEYVKEFFSLKPCIHGSDAHCYEKLFRPDKNRYCWVKSIPTFEGIRQMLFEPKERVYIGETFPSEKQPYNIIKRVKFVDSKNEFQNDWIYLNEGLNSIIGGKSSGKSLLLYYIAKTIISKKIDNLKEDIGKNINFLGYNFENQIGREFNFVVEWADGVEINLKNKEAKRKITYIPQMYINYIAENKNNKNELNNILLSILNENKEFKDNIENINEKINQKSIEINEEISIFFRNKIKLTELENEKIDIGDLEGIKKNIDRLEKESQEIGDISILSDNEKEEYLDISNSIKKKKEELEKYKQNVNIRQLYVNKLIEKIKETSVVLNEIFFEDLNKIDDNEVKENLKSLNENVKSKILEVKNYLQNDNFIFKVCEKTKLLEEEIVNSQNNIKKYEEKMGNMEKQLNLVKLLEQEKQKKVLIEEKEKEIILLKNDLTNKKILEKYQELLALYENKILEHLKFKNISEDIELVVKLKFDIDSFKEKFSEKISKKLVLEKQFGENIFIGNEFKFTKDCHLENIKNIYDKLINNKEEIKINQSYSLEEVLEGLFKDYFSIEYDLVQNGDSLLEMSPGKRGIVLFQLFLQLSNSDTPILIDQPEDNLDNRTIYQELNTFIKNRKLKRQIILVSHNANLVVSTDSENVIVANQEIKKGNNYEYNEKYKFEYINGALEETFNNGKKFHEKGIREHVCEILEGGEKAFKIREKKYGF
ncbi:TrlF family AAA-like ATPase [Fusobacterium polymorphum]|jgi:hypothetical protein|uniref:Polymerase/histidinol phosphatase N-terminal domain-containing protein n=1 Tax=Fusobacterium nucleatum subsp. polymorphum TaxID=76857 RepID=A0A2C6BS29_FUSNP|nr:MULTISPECIES: hypothetical protein [Fusobacterium]MBW9310275.1 hypothetical protein [Fusobacterium nucleatum]PHI17159.1 hypothetical protein CBG56_03305 [Fusobacterium polymorphum]